MRVGGRFRRVQPVPGRGPVAVLRRKRHDRRLLALRRRVPDRRRAARRGGRLPASNDDEFRCVLSVCEQVSRAKMMGSGFERKKPTETAREYARTLEIVSKSRTLETRDSSCEEERTEHDSLPSVETTGDFWDGCTSPNDPFFWVHHANVDRFFTHWQLLADSTNESAALPFSGFPETGHCEGHNRGDVVSELSGFTASLLQPLGAPAAKSTRQLTHADILQGTDPRTTMDWTYDTLPADAHLGRARDRHGTRARVLPRPS